MCKDPASPIEIHSFKQAKTPLRSSKFRSSNQIKHWYAYGFYSIQVARVDICGHISTTKIFFTTNLIFILIIDDHLDFRLLYWLPTKNSSNAPKICKNIHNTYQNCGIKTRIGSRTTTLIIIQKNTSLFLYQLINKQNPYKFNFQLHYLELHIPFSLPTRRQQLVKWILITSHIF